jgi:capsular exopolysaccharide synthesis family protein
MELRELARPLRAWWWLILLAAFLSGVTSYWVEDNSPDIYTARTTLIVGTTISLPNPTDADFKLSRQLATLYADIITRDPVREAVMEQLDLEVLPAYEVNVPDESQLIEVTVRDTVPVRAQAVANALAEQLIERSPANADQEDGTRNEFIESQLVAIEASIEQTEIEIAAKHEELADLVSAATIAQAATDLTALESKLASFRSVYSSFLQSTDQEAVNTISVVEPAVLPRRPSGTEQSSWLIVLLGATLGMTLGIVAAYLLESLNNTLGTEEDVERVLQLPIIGRITRLPNPRWRRNLDLPPGLLIDAPRSPLIEAFRTLKTNLDFAEVDQAVQTLLVASPGTEDGKSTVAVNLAMTMARGGRRVLLLDADLRKPSIHNFLNLSNVGGLSDLVLGEIGVSEASRRTQEPALTVITGGTPPPNPTEVLGSKRMDALLRVLKQEVDTVIIDSPPFLLADASVLASKVDGVIMVVRLGHTMENAIRSMREQLRRAGARVVGVVLNQVGGGSLLSVRTYLGHYAPDPIGGENGGGLLAGRLTALRRLWVREEEHEEPSEAPEP